MGLRGRSSFFFFFFFFKQEACSSLPSTIDWNNLVLPVNGSAANWTCNCCWWWDWIRRRPLLLLLLLLPLVNARPTEEMAACCHNGIRCHAEANVAVKEGCVLLLLLHHVAPLTRYRIRSIPSIWIIIIRLTHLLLLLLLLLAKLNLCFFLLELVSWTCERPDQVSSKWFSWYQLQLLRYCCSSSSSSGKDDPQFCPRKKDRQTDRRQEATEVLDSAAVTGFSSISFFSQEDQQQQQPPPWFLKTSIFCKFYTNKTKHRLLLLLQATNR